MRAHANYMMLDRVELRHTGNDATGLVPGISVPTMRYREKTL